MKGAGEMFPRRMFVGALIGLVSLVGLEACAKEAPVKGAVLRPGQSVEAANKSGRIKVSYVAPTEREYVWDGGARVVRMKPRPALFQGKLGIYSPAEYWGIFPPKTRLVVDESIVDFNNYDEIYNFLHQSSSIMDWVYTSDGLVVGYGRVPGRYQINVEVLQLTMHGEKPKNLNGARDTQIRLFPK